MFSHNCSGYISTTNNDNIATGGLLCCYIHNILGYCYACAAMNQFSYWPIPSPKRCSHCGYCETCGRSNEPSNKIPPVKGSDESGS